MDRKRKSPRPKARPAKAHNAPIRRGSDRTDPDQSGFVIIRLRRDLGPGVSDTLQEFAAELGLPELAAFLARLGGIITRRMVTSLGPDGILEQERANFASEHPPLHSLTSYWRLDFRGKNEIVIRALVEELNRLDVVDLAYLERAASDPVNAANNPLNKNQNYQDAAPIGIDARWAWMQPGGDGAGVGFVDLEEQWIPTHEDLVAKAPSLIFGDNRKGAKDGGVHTGDHGTAVLGEVVGVDNTLGVVGIAPGVTWVRMVSHYDAATGSSGHAADAIVAATKAMAVGDVLLIEMQRGSIPHLPIEVDPADLDAIRFAVAQGMIVVEAAGNGKTDLDLWTEKGRKPLNRNGPDFLDSGAIMVGSADVTVPRRRRLSSNFGSRIDCYAWGESVVTCGGGDLGGTTETDRYTQSFDGTSAASPIIAGAALIVQALHQQSTGSRLSPGQMRTLLSGVGTLQASGRSGFIGRMPNIRAIAEAGFVVTAALAKGQCANPNCTCIMVDPKTTSPVDGKTCGLKCHNDSLHPPADGTCRCVHQVCANNSWSHPGPAGVPGHKCGTTSTTLTKAGGCGCCLNPTTAASVCKAGCRGPDAKGACTCAHAACTTDANPCPSRV